MWEQQDEGRDISVWQPVRLTSTFKSVFCLSFSLLLLFFFPFFFYFSIVGRKLSTTALFRFSLFADVERVQRLLRSFVQRSHIRRNGDADSVARHFANRSSILFYLTVVIPHYTRPVLHPKFFVFVLHFHPDKPPWCLVLG